MQKKIIYNEITLIKVLATLFITWFHFKWTVPQNFAPLFIGGAIGNSLFFYASGHLLKFKEERFYGQWIVGKIIRLLPSIWVFYTLTLLLFPDRMNIAWYNFFYPTTFWFVNCILCYFLIMFLLKGKLSVPVSAEQNVNKTHRGGVNKTLLIIGLLSLSLHISYYFLYVDHHQIVIDDGSIKSWSFYFIFFLWGYYDRINPKTYKGNLKSVFVFCLSIGLFYGYKKIGGQNEMMIFLQFLLIPLLLANAIRSTLHLASYLITFNTPQWFKTICGHLSNWTLDIYIVQVFIINLTMPHIPFPLNVGIVFTLILLAAYVNNYCARKISNVLNRIILRI